MFSRTRFRCIVSLTFGVKLITKDLSFSTSMSAICPSTEVDELTISLLTVFEQRGLIFDLFEALIRAEIEQTGGLYWVFTLNSIWSSID